jgi:hypothetical protein
VPDFLDATRKEITQRLNELKPLVDEFNRLEAAASALADAIGSAATDAGAAVIRRAPGRPRGSGTRKPATADGTPKTARKKPGRPPGRKKAEAPASASTPAARSPARRPGRRKGSGSRAAQALTFVQAEPGITIPELAAKMKIKQNYLYRVLPGLEQESKVQKKGRGWYAKKG